MCMSDSVYYQVRCVILNIIFIAYKQSYGIHMCEEDLELVRALANGEGEVVVVILNINIIFIIMWLL